MTTPEEFAEMLVQLIKEHNDHGGWYDDEEGLKCLRDDALVIPRPRRPGNNAKS